jgi:hypothetical protein
MSATALGQAAFLSTVMVRGLTVFGWVNALLKNRLVAWTSRLVTDARQGVARLTV